MMGLHKIVDAHKHDYEWTSMRLSQGVCSHIDTINQSMDNANSKKARWTYAHLLENGFTGCRMQYNPDIPILSFDELRLLIGLTVIAVRQIKAPMQRAASK